TGKVSELAQAAIREMRQALEDVLNTAQALAAMFDLVRAANAAADAGEMTKADVPAVMRALDKFDEIFAVLKDDDAAKVERALAWAKEEGRLKDASPEVVEMAKSAAMSDAEVDRLVAERQQAKKARNFARADEIRAQLAAAGIILEDTKDGPRWKRK
ncbi:MAG TPA: DALR domain-containing protein, partial [Terriglobales bacterium]|nr:DALR domain-containing protein [Terriglobales bacterium]